MIFTKANHNQINYIFLAMIKMSKIRKKTNEFNNEVFEDDSKESLFDFENFK